MDKFDKCEQIVPDGKGWSPDGGYFTSKDNIIYWDDGDVSNLNDGGIIRIRSDFYPTESFLE